MLLDLGLPECRGLDTLAKIREINDDVPIVVLTDLCDEEVALASLDRGAQDFLLKSQVGADTLSRSIRYAIQRQHMLSELSAANVLLQQKNDSLALKLKLEHRGIQVIRAFEGRQGVQTAMTGPADAIILDFNLPNGQGDYVLRRLKMNPRTKDIPVIMLTGVKDQALEQQMLGMGATRFLTKPLVFEDLLQELQRRLPLSGTPLASASRATC